MVAMVLAQAEPPMPKKKATPDQAYAAVGYIMLALTLMGAGIFAVYRVRKYFKDEELI